MAAKHTTGSMMVLAGPGSGKTAVITARAAFLATTDKGINPNNILVITYSKAAAQEMERRFSLMFEGSHVPKVTFGTFHSVFFRMIRRKKDYSLQQIFSEGERRLLTRGVLAELGYDSDDDFISSVINEMSLVRNELHDLKYYHSTTVSSEDFKDLCYRYQNFKDESNKIDFDDMLCHAYDMLLNDSEEREYWQRHFKYIMIDEFQDINRVQYEAVKILAEASGNLFVVGDDDQSIYRFRGSRPEFLLNFPKDFPETKQVTLSTNYRSTNEIIKYANKLITPNKMRYDKQIIGTDQTGKKPILLTSNDQNQEALKIAELIRKLWKDGANLDEIAITYRLNMQSRAFMDVFLNMNIPYKNRDEMPSIYEHWVTEDLFAYLKVAKRIGLKQKVGYDPNTIRIINKPYRFISKAVLQSLKKNDLDLFRCYATDSNLHVATKNKLEELHTDMIKLSKLETSEAIRFIRKNIGYNSHIIDHAEYRKINPKGLQELAEELQEASKQFPNPEDFMAHAAQVSASAKNSEKTGPCCTLTTLHSAKGLEFERVFVAGVIEEVIPSVRSKTEAEIEEERRLLYVGVTRAKKELYLSTIKTRYDKPAKPSRFL